MPAREATSTCQTTRSKLSIWWHILAVFLLDVLFIYFFEPKNPIYCALLAIIFWKLVWDDHNSTTIDLRYLALFFFLGLFIRNHGIVFSFYAGVTSFLILHAVHEAFALLVPAGPGTSEGEFHYQSTIPDCTEDDAPAYRPCFAGALFLVLSYYLVALPLPDTVLAILYAPMPYTKLPVFCWLVPFLFFLVAIYFYRRDHRAMKQGYHVVYRGFGDGDIYFIGASIGVFGFFLTLLTVTISLIFTWFQVRFFLRHQAAVQEKSGGIEIEH